MGVSPDKPAAPQEDAAEVAGGHHNSVHHASLPHGVHHRKARGALGLPVIREAGGVPLPQNVGEHIVGGVPIAGLFFLDEAKGLLLGLHRTAGADETGLLFNELIRGLPFYGDVFHGASPPFSENKDRRRETAPPIPGHKAHYCVQIQKTPTDYLSCRP